MHPLVVSTLGPREFYELIVNSPTSLLSLPGVCFVELRLGELAEDPERGAIRDLPYSNIGHVRQCLVDLRTKTVHAKMVNRIQPASFPYRTIKSGIFVGNGERLLYFPLPSQEDLRAKLAGTLPNAAKVPCALNRVQVAILPYSSSNSAKHARRKRHTWPTHLSDPPRWASMSPRPVCTRPCVMKSHPCALLRTVSCAYRCPRVQVREHERSHRSTPAGTPADHSQAGLSRVCM